MPDWRAYVRERLPPLTCAPAREAEIVEELAQQLQDIFATAVAGGATPEQAAARVDAEITDWRALAHDLGRAEQPVLARPRALAMTQVEPSVHRFSVGAAMLDFLRDARHAVRALLARPLFAATTLLTFALAIGATTVVFSLVHSVLLSPLPYRQPERLALVRQVIPEIADRVPIVGVNERSFAAWKAGCSAACSNMASVRPRTSTLTGVGEPEGLRGAGVSSTFLQVLGTEPAFGRSFAEAEMVPGSDNVAMLTYASWQRRFSGDPAIIGRTVSLDSVPVEVIGVLPSSFRMPQLPQLSTPGRGSGSVEFLRPLAFTERQRQSWGEFDSTVFLRLPDDVSPEAAEAELASIARAEFADAPIHPYPVVRPLADVITADAKRPLWLMLAAVGAALLIACVNVATLLGARWMGRQRELAIRTALGAGRGRLAALVTVESIILAGAGGILGYVLASVSLRAILARVPAAIPRLDEVQIDLTSLLWTTAITLACALLCALAPAWRAGHVDPGGTLKTAAHTTAGSRTWTTIRAWLVGGEIALTTMLLLVGGLLLASLFNVLNVDRGFSTVSVVAADIDLPNARYKDAAARARFFDSLLESLGRAPGIVNVGLSRVLPLEGQATVDAIIPDGDARPIGQQIVANHLQISAGYFHALGLPLVRGRLLTPDDHARYVAIISQRTADTIWPGQDAIGRSFTRGNQGTSWQVVGIVANSRISGLEEEATLVAYVPYGLATSNRLSLVVRGQGDTRSAVTEARRVARELDPQLPLQRVRTLESVVDDALAMRRFQMWLMVGFCAAGLLLACLGIYGVLSEVVEGRRDELAIRLVLGASPGRVRSLVIRQGLVPIAAGIVVGLVGGISAAKVVVALLFGVTPTQPVVIATVAAVVLIVGMASAIEPAMRAARTPLGLTLRRS